MKIILLNKRCKYHKCLFSTMVLFTSYVFANKKAENVCSALRWTFSCVVSPATSQSEPSGQVFHPLMVCGQRRVTNSSAGIHPSVVMGSRWSLTHPVFPSSSWAELHCRSSWSCTDIYLPSPPCRCDISEIHLWSREREMKWWRMEYFLISYVKKENK